MCPTGYKKDSLHGSDQWTAELLSTERSFNLESRDISYSTVGEVFL